MNTLQASFIGALVAFAVLDQAWANFYATEFYRRHWGHLMEDRPAWRPILLLYPLGAAGVVYFAAFPGLEAASLRVAALRGAAFGACVYGTFNLTNMAMLKRWSPKAAVVDVAWSVCFMTAVSAAAYWAGSLA